MHAVLRSSWFTLAGLVFVGCAPATAVQPPRAEPRPAADPAGPREAPVTAPRGPAVPPVEPPADPDDKPTAVAAPAKPTITVAFVIAPQVGAHAPVLRVTVNNPGSTPVPLTRFDDPACFARHYLRLELTRPGGKTGAPGGCSVRDWPGIEGQLAPNTATTIELPLAALFPRLRRGVYELDVDWDPSKLEDMRPGTGIQASMSSLNVSKFAIAPVLATVKIAAGKSAALPGGHRLALGRHGHKSVQAGGPNSPLILHGEFTRAGHEATEFSTNVHLDESPLFELDGHVFELVEHEYDRWTKLRYYGPLALD